jgi:Ca2+/Na+ antiporter
MTEALYQFDFSEEKAKKNNRDIIFLILVLIVCAGVLALYITDFQVKEALLLFCIPSLYLLVIFAIEAPLLRLRQRKIKAFVYDDRIVKGCGKHENSIPWDSITRVKIVEDNKGETVRIQLRGRDKATLWLFGLNEMEKLADQIRERARGEISIRIKRNKLSVRTAGVMSAVVTMLIMILITSLGAIAEDIFAILFVFAVSCFLLLFRPLSRLDAWPKWLETVCILLMFALGIWGLVSFLHNGFLP